MEQVKIFELTDVSEIFNLSISGNFLFFINDITILCRVRTDGTNFKELTPIGSSNDTFSIEPLK